MAHFDNCDVCHILITKTKVVLVYSRTHRKHHLSLQVSGDGRVTSSSGTICCGLFLLVCEEWISTIGQQ